ncbi:MAG: hypothetical protein E6H07_11105 [Bacteroidetes bacterium]|nr:MAG: hypothetical protein E6H07_11105 [Bacteroidota bacterium]
MDENIIKLVRDLNDLDRQLVKVEGKMIKPSQCFRYETDPFHFMFNTNCPEELKQQVQSIFDRYKYMPSHKNDTSSQRVR